MCQDTELLQVLVEGAPVQVTLQLHIELVARGDLRSGMFVVLFYPETSTTLTTCSVDILFDSEERHYDLNYRYMIYNLNHRLQSNDTENNICKVAVRDCYVKIIYTLMFE